MSELAAALAKRLFELADVAIEAGPLTWEEATAEGRAPWMKLAAECIRQMRWAREQGCRHSLGVAGNESMSLAPDYWK